MREFVIVPFDDLEAAEGRRVASDVTVRLRLGSTERELDLTHGHLAELEALLEPWLTAGHAPGTQPAPAGTGGAGVLSARRQYTKGMRAFAREQGLSYHSPGSNGYYYSKELRDAYAAHLESQGARQPQAGG
jgi:hypothetical protein